MRIFICFIIFLAFYRLGQGQYCLNAGPTSNADSNVELVMLTGQSGTINHVGCPSQIGVEVYLNESATLSAGSAYSLQVDYGTCGGNYPSAGTVWIDFDLSQTFTQNEVVGTWVGTPPSTPVTYTIQVPQNAHNGQTRMRVTQQEAGQLPLNPCASFSWGSVMDFGITIVNGLDCSGFAGDDMSSAINVSTLPFLDTVDLSYCYGNQNIVYDSPDIFYKLFLNPTISEVNISTCGSNFDTYLTILDPQGQVLGYNDDGACAPSSTLSFSVGDLGFVYLIVEGWGNETGTANIEINANYLGFEEGSMHDILISPNPANEKIEFNAQLDNLIIYDTYGQIVYRGNGPHNFVDVSGFVEGSYFVKGYVNQIPVIKHFTKL